MEVQKYIKEKGVDSLEKDLGIKVKWYPDRKIYVLNYDQVASPKRHPVVVECRSLILDGAFNVVSRSFDRFFNLGEDNNVANIDFSRAVVFEKADGSLVKFYYEPQAGQWEISTRGMAFAEGNHSAGGTFLTHILSAAKINSFKAYHSLAKVVLDRDFTYIFEYIGPENRIVTPYQESKLVLIGARRCSSPYDELDLETLENLCDVLRMLGVNMRMPRVAKLATTEAKEIVAAAAELKDLQEGFVVCDMKTYVRAKVKNPTYISVHHMKGDPSGGMAVGKKHICEIVLQGEADEYLRYFPDHKEMFEPYVAKYGVVLEEMRELYDKVSVLETQKEYAAAVVGTPYAKWLFIARKRGTSVLAAFAEDKIEAKLPLLM